MIWTGFIMGLMSSVHCVGMCGPIALALPIPSGSSRIPAILLYNAGRTVTYSLLGVMAGFFGYMVVLSGFQNYLSVLCGLLVSMTALLSLMNFSFGTYFTKMPVFFLQFKNQFTNLLQQRTLASLFLIGLLNGLLPCGVIYIVMTGAIAMGTAARGGLYMLLFGAGTVPFMFLMSYIKVINWKGRKYFKYAVPVVSLLVGVLLMMRGLNLNIPYVSPVSSPEGITCCSAVKCHQGK